MAYGVDLNTTVEPEEFIQRRLEASESLGENSTLSWSSAVTTTSVHTVRTSSTFDLSTINPDTPATTTDFATSGDSTLTVTSDDTSTSLSMSTGSASTSTPRSTSSYPMFTNTTDNITTTTVEPQGCPEYYNWCSYTPVIFLSQFLVGVACIGIGYPIAQIMSYALYSKILGPKPQAVWMGWLTAAGSAARAIGPVFVTQIYNSYGPRVTFSACCGVLLATIIFICVIFKKLVPFAVQTKLISPVRN